MVSFVDLLPAARRTRVVPVFGEGVDVRSLKLREICDIIWSNPEIGALMAERRVDAQTLIDTAPRAAAQAIALATGHGQDEAEIAAIGEMPPGTQLSLLLAVLELSAPDGVSPLMEAVTRMLQGGGRVEPSGTAPDGNMPPRSNGSLPAVTA